MLKALILSFSLCFFWLSPMIAQPNYLSLEEALEVEDPSTVTAISLKRERLKVIPEQLFQFKNLKYLELKKNKLKELPNTGWEVFSQLRFIDVSQNKLSKLPEAWSTLPLDSLIANRNYLIELPESYSKIESLRYLDVWSNELDWLPAGFKTHPQLKKVDMRGISMNNDHIKTLLESFPKIEILTSPGCNCGS